MQSYLINLDRSPDRLKFFSEQAHTLQLPFERIPAVDGRQLTAGELRDSLAPTFEFQPINAGEIGLFMSHKIAWQRLIDSGKKCAAIFEDDALLSPSIRKVLDAVDQEVTSFDVIKLETTLRRVVCQTDGQMLSCGNQLSRLLSWHGGTAGYVISADCARRLLVLREKLADPIDQVMFNPGSRISSSLRILQVSPAVCIQKDIHDKADAAAFGTTIDRNVTRKGLFRHGPLVDLRRLLKKQLEGRRRRLLALKPGNTHEAIDFESDVASERAA